RQRELEGIAGIDTEDTIMVTPAILAERERAKAEEQEKGGLPKAKPEPTTGSGVDADTDLDDLIFSETPEAEESTGRSKPTLSLPPLEEQNAFPAVEIPIPPDEIATIAREENAPAKPAPPPPSPSAPPISTPPVGAPASVPATTSTPAPPAANRPGSPSDDKPVPRQEQSVEDKKRATGSNKTAPAASEPKPVEDVQFSAYYPRDVQPQNWYALTVYIYKALAAEKVVADAQRTLGGLMATVRRVIEAARQTIPEGTPITATPQLDGFQFNPPSITIGFFEDWHRLDFKLRALNAPLNQATNGFMTFTVEGIIVADIPLSVYVGDSSAAASGNMVTMTQKLYKAIFCSYSHDDEKIVERVERAYKILGFDFLRDVNSLKSGQDWNEELYELIDNADIFQLFWSSTAAKSDYVKREWQHALKLDRDKSNFIRPVYWEDPMPSVPKALEHIHFAYEPTLDD
ncbi:MAG TPA: toll/interleukin-1 receptor domain-containing protein, partial [Phototrophicaceae bacterium]|nr:toll/interleukin-1 receptor domain-containing protein [Phototrophicaceae bacterium]